LFSCPAKQWPRRLKPVAHLLAENHPADILTVEGHMSRAGVMAALLSLGLGCLFGSRAHGEDNVPGDRPQPSSLGEPSDSEATTAPFSIENIDRTSRLLVVRSPDGSRMTVKVAPTVAAFDDLERGNRVELDYYPAAVLSFGAANSPAAQMQEAPTRANAPPLGPAAGQVITTPARVTAVDKTNGELQITTADGQPQTLLVREPAERRELRSLRPGQTVVVTYAQPVAVGLHMDGNG
jgi:hypothetical protein